MILTENYDLSGNGEVMLRLPEGTYGVITQFDFNKAVLLVGGEEYSSMPIFPDSWLKEGTGLTDGVMILQGQAFGFRSTEQVEVTFQILVNRPDLSISVATS